MGQTVGTLHIGKAQLQPGAIPFINLPRSLVELLRQCVYEVAEGYGLCQEELKKIVQISLHEYFVRLSDSSIDECSEALFALFSADVPPNSDEASIDSFEFLSTTAIISGMQLDEKVNFIFNLFDFNESGRLNINEATLAFRVLASGTSKISLSALIEVDVIDKVALEGFELSLPNNLKYSQAMAIENHSLNKQDFCAYVFNCAETISILKHFDDIFVGEPAKFSACLETESIELVPLRFHNPMDTSPPTDEPWRDQLRFLQSKGDEETTLSPPTGGLSIDWIYGRNARTPAMYCSNGEVIYAAGSTVVKVSTDCGGKAMQKYFMGHSGHVTSIDVFEMHGSLGEVVASGDVGSEPRICVWSSNTLSSVVTLPCFHQSGTSKLNFSPSGELLLSLGNDDLNSVAVYNWRVNKVLFTSIVAGTDVFDCSFLASDDSFGACTTDAVYFWTRLEPHFPYIKQRGVFNRLSTREIMTSIACVGSTVVTGSLRGRLWVWEGRVCTKQVNALRSGKVTQLHAPRNNEGVALCVATNGSLHLLNDNLEILHRLSPNRRFGDYERMIESICWHSELERVMVGQNGNGLYHLSVCKENDVNIIADGHFDLREVSMCNDNIITVGRDRIKVWDVTEHRVLRECSIEAMASCVSYNGFLDQIAVGFGADEARSSSDKSFIVLKGEDFQVIHHGCNCVKSLTVCKFSKDGKLLAFGSADTNIYIHQCNERGFPLLATARGHTGPISRLDFGLENGSDTSTVIRSNSIIGEAMFWTTRGKLQTPLSQRDTIWESQSCIYTACLERVHNSYDEHKGRVTSSCLLSCNEEKSIIVGDSKGSLRVFSYPVITSHPLFLEYDGHSGSIQSIEISIDRKAVFTMSHGDSCLFQWKHKSMSWDQGLPTAPMRASMQYTLPFVKSLDMQTIIEQMDTLNFNRSNVEKKKVVRKPRPWSRSIIAPTKFIPNNGPLPYSQLILERVHGYNGNGVKNNLQYLSAKNSIIYSVGKILVRYDVEEDKQEFCNVARSEIMCLAVHHEKSICAIGQQGAFPAILIVDLTTMEPLSFLNGHVRTVLCLDIDVSAKFVVSVSSGQEIVVHDWKNGTAIASSQTYGIGTFDVRFLKGNSDHFVECGACFVRFWNIKGCSLSFDEVKLDSLENCVQYYSCIGWNGNNLVVGTSSGDIIQFIENKPGKKRIKAHQSAVTNVSSAEDGFATNDIAGVKFWNYSAMRCMFSIDTQTIGTNHGISSLCWTKGTILVGTSGNEIWKLSSDDGSNLKEDGKALVSSHASSPMGLSVHPRGTFATCADSQELRVWNVFDQQENVSIDLGMSARSCAFSPDSNGRMIAVGFGKPVKENARTINGKWIILNLADDGDVGSWDKKICVYGLATETKPAVSINVTLLSMIDLTSPPTHFDFSRDGKYLRANTECHELRFFEAGPGLHIKEPSRLKDTQWETETCIFGWNVQGIWHKDLEAEIVSLDCSVEHCPTIASGDTCGRLRIFQFPCTTASAQYITYPAHIGPVGKVRWTPGGYLVSTGENDNAVMVWRQEVDEGLPDSSDDVVLAAAHLDPDNTLAANDNVVCHTALYDFTGQVIYPSSGNCVVFDKNRSCHEPRNLFQKHEATVSAMCTSHTRQLLASSDAKNIRLWDSQTCTEVAMLSDDRQRRVSTLCFSPDDTRLASVSSNGQNQIICVWATLGRKWNDAHLVLHTLAGREKVHFCHFAAFNATQNYLVSGGGRHVRFWSEQNSTLVVSQGVLPRQLADTTFLCGSSTDQKVVTGTESGSLVAWREKKIAKEVQGHNDAVLSLCACPEGLVSGCRRGVVILWSKSLQKVASFDVASPSPSWPRSAIRSIDVAPHSNGYSTVKILARTGSSDIFEISCVTGSVTSLVSEAICIDRVTSVAPNPLGQT